MAGSFHSSQWDFGDGSPASGELHPAHVLALPGVYTPTLTISGPGGSASQARPGYIQALPRPVAEVALDGPELTGLNVACPFTATVSPVTTTVPLTYTWEATGQASVTHSGGLSATLSLSWDAPGAKTVTVTVANAVVTATATHAVAVHAPPLAGFTASPSSGPAPLAVAFANTSSGQFTSLWDFGDGITSTLHSPAHTYQAPGAYTVTLTVSGPGGSDTAEGTVTVLPAPPATVTIGGPLTATPGVGCPFTAAVAPPTAALPITYTSRATRQEAVTHGGVLALTDAVTFTWSLSGPQAITLTATNAGGAVTATRALTVHTPPRAGFTASPTAGPAPLAVQFTNTSTADLDSSEWHFGDGITSALESPAHVYAVPGAYTVSLTVSGPAGSHTATRPAYITVRPCIYLPLVLRLAPATSPSPSGSR